MTQDTLKNPLGGLVEALTAHREAKMLTKVAEARRRRREALAAAQAEADKARTNSCASKNEDI